MIQATTILACSGGLAIAHQRFLTPTNRPQHDVMDNSRYQISEPATELVRRTAIIAQSLPAEWLKEFDNSILFLATHYSKTLNASIIEATKRSVRLELMHWAHQTIKNPTKFPEPLITADAEEIAKEVTSLNIPEIFIEISRLHQNTAIKLCINTIFQEKCSQEIANEAITFLLKSINYYFDNSVNKLTNIIHKEKLSATHSKKDAKYNLIKNLLDNRFVDANIASRELNYNINSTHQCGIAWAPKDKVQLTELEKMTIKIITKISTAQSIFIPMEHDTIVFWLNLKNPITAQQLSKVPHHYPARLVLGPLGQGPDGFRRSYQDALTTQRILTQFNAKTKFATYYDTQLIEAFAHNMDFTKEFINTTLGKLLAAPPELQKSLYIFLREGCNLTKSASILGIHRNTLLTRIDRATSLLPTDLNEHRIQISVALHALLWSQIP